MHSTGRNNIVTGKEGNIENIFRLMDNYAKLMHEQIEDLITLASDFSTFKDESPYKPPYPINIYDYYGGLHERGTSYFLGEILNYKENGNSILVKLFAKKFLVPLGFDISLVKTPKVKCEEQNVDVLIWEKGKYAIVIENKLRGAVFQMNQLARYVELQIIKGYSIGQIFVVVLPDSVETYKDHLNPSTWRLPPDWRVPSYKRECRYSDFTHCLCDFDQVPIDKCNECKKDFKALFSKYTIVITKELSNWLEKDCFYAIPNKECILKSAVIQFADYLKGIYNDRITDKFKMKLEEYLCEKLFTPDMTLEDQINIISKEYNDTDALLSALYNLRLKKYQMLLLEWRRNLINKLKDEKQTKLLTYLQKEDPEDSIGLKSFGINMFGVWCGCWAPAGKDDVKNYWGFQCDNARQDQIDKVNEIIRVANIRRDDIGRISNNNSFIAWNYTDNGDKICEEFYTIAVNMGYLQEELQS